ncbi:MAG: Rrf2 family transcriptional regulator [Planctomycetota bacterium]
MKLSRTIAYAVQAILQLAAAPPGTPVACGRLAADGRMPERFLLQVLRSLVRAGILRSVRGVEGGYLMGRDAADISLLDVLEALDNPVIPSVPPLEGLPDAARQRMLATLNRVAAVTRQELSRVTMAQLGSPTQPAPADGT